MWEQAWYKQNRLSCSSQIDLSNFLSLNTQTQHLTQKLYTRTNHHTPTQTLHPNTIPLSLPNLKPKLKTKIQKYKYNGLQKYK